MEFDQNPWKFLQGSSLDALGNRIFRGLGLGVVDWSFIKTWGELSLRFESFVQMTLSFSGSGVFVLTKGMP